MAPAAVLLVFAHPEIAYCASFKCEVLTKAHRFSSHASWPTADDRPHSASRPAFNWSVEVYYRQVVWDGEHVRPRLTAPQEADWAEQAHKPDLG